MTSSTRRLGAAVLVLGLVAAVAVLAGPAPGEAVDVTHEDGSDHHDGDDGSFLPGPGAAGAVGAAVLGAAALRFRENG